ncbi:MAG: MerR family transcriptional regulator [bacterium]
MPAQRTTNFMKRGDLAKITSCNIETIRYYEKICLLDKPHRNSKGHRLYTIEDQTRLRFILRCRELGFSISEIRSLFELVDSGSYSCEEIYQHTQRHISSIEKKINDLTKLNQTLMKMSEDCSKGDAPDCPIIDTLSS